MRPAIWITFATHILRVYGYSLLMRVSSVYTCFKTHAYQWWHMHGKFNSRISLKVWSTRTYPDRQWACYTTNIKQTSTDLPRNLWWHVYIMQVLTTFTLWLCEISISYYLQGKNLINFSKCVSVQKQYNLLQYSVQNSGLPDWRLSYLQNI